jgi:DNA-binding LacI/PurR family transcriptional regulator
VVAGHARTSFDRFFELHRTARTIQVRLTKHQRLGLDTLRSEVTFEAGLEPALQASRRADIWVFSSAEQAARACAFAESRGMRVPRDVSVLCLEDDPRYYGLGISSCGPDLDRIGYLMAHTLLGDVPLAYSSRGFLEAFCSVVDKQTTRP